jgi:hypothetical protein
MDIFAFNKEDDSTLEALIYLANPILMERFLRFFEFPPLDMVKFLQKYTFQVPNSWLSDNNLDAFYQARIWHVMHSLNTRSAWRYKKVPYISSWDRSYVHLIKAQPFGSLGDNTHLHGPP